MPTTANFSLEYPDDNSSVDIAGHFETLADDVDEAINTRLALTGGTLTGSLSGTSLSLSSTLSVTGTTTLTGDLSISKAQPYIFIDKTNANWQGIAFRTGTSNRWALQVNNVSESSTATGSDLVLTAYNNSGSTLSTPLSITRSTGAVTLTGDLTISKASPVLSINASSGDPVVSIDGAAGQIKSTRYRTGTSLRWLTGANATAESGSNAGSDFVIQRYNDAGAGLGAALTITRSTGAVTLTGTLNGKVVDDLVTGPASATDNALVRFDNTTGKVVQNSGITVDDSGYITSDVTVSKAAAALNVTGASGDSNVFVSGAAGTWRGMGFRTGSSRRWMWYASSTAESGSSAGSNFELYRVTDDSIERRTSRVERATGKATFYDVGATAGLELGTSGPRVMSGTGSPEGVVTAPVGSQWIDTAATTGAVAWRKASGTGSSGWVVEYGDTGLRQCTVSETAVFTHAPYTAADPGAVLFLRRVGNVVTATFKRGAAPTWATNYTGIITLPLGWKTRSFGGDYMGTYFPLMDGSAVGTTKTLYFTSTNVLSAAGTWVTGTQYWGSAQWVTEDAWPSSLPGSAV